MNGRCTPEEIGAAIRAARAKRGLTQADLAHQAGVSRSWLIGVEKGTRPRAMRTKLVAVLEVLDIDVPGEDSPADEDMVAGDMAALAIQRYLAPQVKWSMAPVLEHMQRLHVQKLNPHLALSQLPALQALQNYSARVAASQLPALQALQNYSTQIAQSQSPVLRALENQNAQLARSIQPILASAQMQIPTVTIPKKAFENLPSPTLYTLAKIPPMRLPAVSTDAVTHAAVAAIRAAAPTLRWATQEAEAEQTQEPEEDVSSVLQQRNAHLQRILDTGEFPEYPQPTGKGAAQALPGGPVDES